MEAKRRPPDIADFSKRSIVITAAHMILAAAVLSVVRLAYHIPVARLVLPFMLISSCGMVFAIGGHWASRARARKQEFIRRMSIAAFIYLECTVVGGLASAVWLGFMSRHEALTGVGPFLAVAMAISAGVLPYGLKDLAGLDEPARLPTAEHRDDLP